VEKDVAEDIGVSWTGSLTVIHVPEIWKGVRSVLTPRGAQEMIVLSMSHPPDKGVGKDVCGSLGIKDVSQAVGRLKPSMKGTCTILTPGGPQEMLMVSRAGVYKLAFSAGWQSGRVAIRMRPLGDASK
jgi:hypothetical protein